MPLKISFEPYSEAIYQALSREIFEKNDSISNDSIGEPKEELLHRWKQKVPFSARTALTNMEVA